jgi:uncharacterized protein (DUF362 family)
VQASDLEAELEAEVRAMLDGCARRHPDRPDLQLRRILLLGLEREQVVTVAYRDDVLGPRIARLPVPPEVRRIVRHCLEWAWKDEGTHSDYLRGWLLRTGHPEPALVIFAHQVEGAISGWVTAVRQNDRPRDAPTRTAVAGALLAGARLARRIPPLLAQELRGATFERYCRLNAALERSAEMGYERAVTLASTDEERAIFERIRIDEHHHSRAFAILADAFDGDALAPGASAEQLAADLSAVSPWFVPADVRGPGGRPSALGSGEPVWVHAGGESMHEVLERTLDDAGLGQVIAGRAAEGRDRVVIRASFMLGYDRRDRSNVNDPAVVETVAAYARRHGARDVAVLEAPTVYGRYFGGRSVHDVAAYFGYRSATYRVVDAGADQVPYDVGRGLGRRTISATWRDADVRVVLPKLRTNPAERAHLGLSSLEGTGGGIDDTVHADREVHYRNAVMMVLDAAPPDFSVVEAWGDVADGPFGVMACATPAVEHRFYAGADVIAVDAAVLADLGLADPREAPIMRTACEWFGFDPRPDVRGERGPIDASFRRPWESRWFRLVSALSYPVYIYASRHGRLFVPRFDRQAFPELSPPGKGTRAIRFLTQRMFGLHPPSARPLAVDGNPPRNQPPG